LVLEAYELGQSRHFVYNDGGYLNRRIDGRGLLRELQYDTLGCNTAEIWDNTAADAEMNANRQSTLSFTHDALGRLTAAADPAASYDYQYDALGRRTSVTHDIAGVGFPIVLASAYDAASNRTSLSATIDTTADFMNQYTYDALHRMTRIEQSGVTSGNAVAEKRIDLSYDATSQYQTITRYADLAPTKLVATSDYTFDAAGRLTALTHAQGATPLAGYTWTYDAAHRVTELTSLLDGTAEYTYDQTDQLTGADYTAGAGLPPARQSDDDRLRHRRQQPGPVRRRIRLPIRRRRQPHSPHAHRQRRSHRLQLGLPQPVDPSQHPHN
jgi:YD repeat-containing protein